MAHLIAIYASKGGVGKSFIAANLAVDLQLQSREKVLLIDFSLPISTSSELLLALPGVKKLDLLLASSSAVSGTLLASYASQHRSGINVLALSGGNHWRDKHLLNEERIETILHELSGHYTYIVIDCGLNFGKLAEKIIDLSSLLLLPLTPEPLSVSKAVDDFALLRSLNFIGSLVKPVFNRSDEHREVDSKMIERQLGHNIFASLPYDPKVTEIAGKGQLYPLDTPRHPLGKAFSKLTTMVLETLTSDTGKLSPLRSATSSNGTKTNDEAIHNQQEQLQRLIHQKLLESFDFRQLDMAVLENDSTKMATLRHDLSDHILKLLDEHTEISSRNERREAVRTVLQEVLGLGMLEDLLADNTISEIMVNRWDQIYIERAGKLEMTGRRFFSEGHLVRIIERIVAPLGKRVDTSTPMVDARLPDGSRVNGIIPPLAIHGACLTIRKFPEKHLDMPSLLEKNSINAAMADFAEAAVKARLNILISGGTGTGKTTLLNVFSGFIPPDERIVTVEDSAELRLQQPHVVTLESRPANIEGSGEVTIRDLVKNTLRMRPDRIIVGECRGAEALDMLQAMNTGHDGSLTTIHANSAREAVARLETLVMFTGFDLPQKAIREQIVSAFDLIVQIKRFKDGSRKIIQMVEITGLENEVVTMGEIFTYKPTASGNSDIVEGEFMPSGYIPRCLTLFAEKGLPVKRSNFITETQGF